MIENKIKEITSEIGNAIIVLKGFNITDLPYKNKYFSFNIEFYDNLNLDEIKGQIEDDVIKNRAFDCNYKWMTIEEYQLFKEYIIINKMPIAVLENNLYYKQFPYRNTLSDIKNIYHNLYFQEYNELDVENEGVLKNVSKFYGKIDYSKQSGNYYVNYIEIEEKVYKYNMYEEDQVKVDFSSECHSDNVQRIELSEDELPFLDLETEILNDNSKKNIIFILSGPKEDLPNRYLERLSVLLTLKNFNLFFDTVSIRRLTIRNEKSYLRILKDVYGYDSFKEILFYKDIESGSKEKIEISQAQIIDDIVIQAEKAMNGETFRDVYITASTSSGKSVMFQIPALYLSEKYVDNKPITIVISPLIGLMNDQVDSMKRKGVTSFATINGDTPPFEREIILEKIQNKEIDMLYLSPESLQSRSDIKMLIGDRKIGIVIIDEAHIVTTWGRSFRADYWYLGIYLAKLRKEYKFPIVTFTATAIYGGSEDMYLDTRNTLNMISPISYFGNVRREDIYMRVLSSVKDFKAEGNDYRKTKNALALRHLKNAKKNKQKSLIYFPTVRLLIDFYNFIVQNEPDIAKITGKYYGSLQKEEKDEVLSEYKSGEIQFVIATKAFGMGIDIPDITNVYHYAPTGNVVDYIQEIGRAARNKSMVEHGYGIIDFLPNDMTEVKQLHGMSAIKKNQIIEVMRKVLSIYKEKGNNRNLIISSEDFKYIFSQNKRDEDSLDNKLKTVLLMIEKDFSSPNKLGYSPFVARPRSLFGNDLIFVTPELESIFMKSRLRNFFSKSFDITGSMYSAVYQVNLSGIWEKYYKNMSFPSFKYTLFNKKEGEKMQHKSIFDKFVYASGIEVSFDNNNSAENIISEYRIILQSFEDFLNEKKISGRQFTVIDLGNHFMKTLKIHDRFEARSFAQATINSAFEFGKIKEINFISERSNSNSDNQKYIVHQDSDIFSKFIISSIKNALSPNINYVKSSNKIISFSLRLNSNEIDSKIAALGIGEARKLLSYQVLGGNNPQIYLRVNSIYPLEKAIKQGDFYQNSILKDVQAKHYTSVEMLRYLFTKEQPEKSPKERIYNYTKWFWDNIEDYFMGILPNDVRNNLSKEYKS